MQDQEIISRLKEGEFYEVYSFFRFSGVWTSTKPYGIMSEVYSHLTKDERNPKGQRMRTDCQGCIEQAAAHIFKTFPVWNEYEQRLIDSKFNEVYQFFLKHGVWISKDPLDVMPEIWEKLGNKKLRPNYLIECPGEIGKIAKEVYNKYKYIWH